MKLLFVCTGNTCRSPMAEAIARRLAAERGFRDIEVASAGTGAHDGGPVSDGALLVALEHGLDLNTHRSRALTRDLVAQADLILAMGPAHLERIHALGGDGKGVLLASYASRGTSDQSVNDPFGADLDEYRRTFAELETAIGRVLDRLALDRARE